MAIYKSIKPRQPGERIGHTSKRCPECNGHAEVVEKTIERTVCICSRCKTTITLQKNPLDVTKQQAKFGGFVVRDKSGENKETKKEPDETKDADKKEKTDDVDSLAVFQKALATTSVVSFDYCDSHGNSTSRSIEPYKLTKDKKGLFIVFGHCQDKNATRCFKLDNMQEVKLQDDKYEPKYDIEDLSGDE